MFYNKYAMSKEDSKGYAQLLMPNLIQSNLMLAHDLEQIPTTTEVRRKFALPVCELKAGPITIDIQRLRSAYIYIVDKIWDPVYPWVAFEVLFYLITGKTVGEPIYSNSGFCSSMLEQEFTSYADDTDTCHTEMSLQIMMFILFKAELNCTDVERKYLAFLMCNYGLITCGAGLLYVDNANHKEFCESLENVKDMEDFTCSDFMTFLHKLCLRGPAQFKLIP